MDYEFMLSDEALREFRRIAESDKMTFANDEELREAAMRVIHLTLFIKERLLPQSPEQINDI